MIRALIVSSALIAAVACGEKPSISDKPRDAAPSAAAPVSNAPAQPADASNSGAPPPAAAAPADKVASDSGLATAGGAITGKVLETMDSGGYTYIKLAAGGGEVWAAVNQAKVKKGQSVTVVNAVQMDGFESKTLKRKFDHILFGSLAVPAGAPVPGTQAGAQAANATAPKEQTGLPPGHPNPQDGSMQNMVAAQHAAAGQGAGAQDIGKIEVARATSANGHTVAEVFAKKATLKDKPVEVRGKVVKFLPQIMGKNWIHLRDGSGSPDKKNNDLTVTTKDAPNVGDVVVVRGVVHTDKDLGAGYQYPVLIEDAKIVR